MYENRQQFFSRAEQSRAEQSRAEQSRAEQSRAEQSRAEQSRAEQSRAERRFVGFDILKFICAFLIICIHTPFPGIAGEYVIALTRIAVPIFFIITGYYYIDTVKRKRVWQQIKKIFLLMIEANALFLVWKCFYAVVVSGNGIMVYLGQTFTLKSVVKFLILNESPLNGHLWYLGAILYVLLIMVFIDRFGLRRLLWVATPILLVCDLVLGKYSLLIFKQEFPYILVRNFLFVGLPYFSTGMLLRKIVKSNKVFLLAFSTVLFSLTTLAERYFLVYAGANATRDHYISTTFLAVTVFLLFREIYRHRKPSKAENVMAYIGKKYSTWVYIIHPIFITVFSVVVRKAGIFDYYKFVAPAIVYGASIAFVAMVRTYISKSVKRKEIRR